MGASGTKADLAGVRTGAAARIGSLAVSGRYHKSPNVLTDKYTVSANVLGSGYSGSVYKASAKDGGKVYAVKEFKLSGLDSEKKKELEAECEIFLSLDHPHVCRLVDVYESADKLSLVMECMEGGEVFDRVLEKKKYSEAEAADAAYQMLLSINYLHKHEICHRDLKLENFLYETKTGDHLKLIDFGFSKIYDANTKMRTSCGTLAYVAPEVLNKSYSLKCDMWSLGVVVFILCTGYMPFGGPESKQMKDIKAGQYSVKDAFRNLSKDAQDFLKKLIVVDPNKRLSAEEALAHDFITKRSERAKAAEGVEVDADIANSLRDFAQASTFRRACLSAMAWSLTNEERQQLRDAFLEMDTSKNGTITLPEFKKVVQDKFEITDTKVQEMFDAVDTSSNHEIHYTEFLAAMVSTRVKMHDDLLMSAFRRFDVDNTGFIDESDLRTVLGETYEGHEIASLLAEADIDKDGKLSYQEFFAFVTSDSGHDSKATEVAHKLIEKEHAKQEKEKTPASGGGFFKGFKLRI